MGDIINIKDFQAVDYNKTLEYYEGRKQEFFDTYGAEAKPGEDPLITSLREVLNINTELASKAYVSEKYGVNDGSVNEFESRRAAEELDKWVKAVDNAQAIARDKIERMGYKNEDAFYDSIDKMLNKEDK